MSGIVGAFLLPSHQTAETVYDQLKLLVPRLENRGQEGFGIALFTHKEGILRYQSSRPVSEFAIDLAKCDSANTTAAIAHIRYPSSLAMGDEDNEPLTSYDPSHPQNSIALSFSGGLVNGDELRKELSAQGVRFHGRTDAEVLLKLIESICQRDYWSQNHPIDYEKLFREVDRRADGAISALIIDGQGNLIAFRNQTGLRPLEFMRTDDGFLLFASENCAFAGLHGKIEEIPPSHIKVIDGQSGECVDYFVGNVRHSAKLCAYETLYLGNPKTLVDGQSHLVTRRNIGTELGKIIAPVLRASDSPIIVSSMPHTGRPYADGLFSALEMAHGELVQRHEVIELHSSRRTLIGIVGQRKSLISQKYRVAEKHVTGSTIIIADEALIRGDTSHAVTDMLFNAGAKAVHWAIGSPPIVGPNYYGIGINTMDELAFWQIWKDLSPDAQRESLRLHNTNPATLKIIENMVAARISATAVTYLPFRSLTSLLPRGSEGNDLSPFTLEMPTPAGQRRANENLKKLMAGLNCAQSSLA